MWEIATTTGPAGPFHATMPPDDTGPQIWVHRIPRPALVLGSTQPDELVDHDRARSAGIEVCRRRSGGGLVHIDPATDCWVDVIVPTGSILWDADVGRAFHWLGRHWSLVLTELGTAPPPPRTVVHRTRTATAAGRLWCFADVGHGEVTIDGSKVVGLSQRRTRHWLRLQSLVIGSWPGRELLRFVDTDVVGRRLGAGGAEDGSLDPGRVEAGFPGSKPGPSPERLADAFVARLPTP